MFTAKSETKRRQNLLPNFAPLVTSAVIRLFNQPGGQTGERKWSWESRPVAWLSCCSQRVCIKTEWNTTPNKSCLCPWAPGGDYYQIGKKPAELWEGRTAEETELGLRLRGCNVVGPPPSLGENWAKTAAHCPQENQEAMIPHPMWTRQLTGMGNFPEDKTKCPASRPDQGLFTT